MDLSTEYLGLKLKNPIIAGSSGLTSSPAKIKSLEENGAAAVVLKSIFEEEIIFEYEDHLKEAEKLGLDPEQYDYFDYQIKGDKVDKYIKLVKESKEKVSIPIIASVNCMYSHEWLYFAKKLQDAGADAIELNMFFLPSELDRSAEEKERTYFEIIEKVKEAVSIPITLKISYYFSNLGNMVQKLSNTGISGLVLFNRFFSPDFDINTFEVKQSNVLSDPAELAISLRWVSLLANKVNCDLVASTGIHDGNAVIKQLLAGAKAVQVASSLYKNGMGHIGVMLDTLETWMKEKNFKNINEFRGKMSQAKADNPAIYERVQFMKYFGSKK